MSLKQSIFFNGITSTSSVGTSLLGNIGTAVMMEKDQGVDPAQLISKIPMGMRVPGLRDKLVKIISDYTMQLQLRESCNLVLKADCFELLKKLCYQQRRPNQLLHSLGLYNIPTSSCIELFQIFASKDY